MGCLILKSNIGPEPVMGNIKYLEGLKNAFLINYVLQILEGENT